MNKFSIFLPVIDETFSLEKTISEIQKSSSKFVSKYLIVISKKKTTNQSLKTILNLKKKLRKKIILVYQKKPYLGGALKSAIPLVKTSHFILMASDLETNPKDVAKFIKFSLKYPENIIIGTRWGKKKSFEGYSKIKLILNKLFQVFFSVLFKVQLSDLTFGYRVYPSKLIKDINLKEEMHPILFESILIPIKLKAKIIEIPVKWKTRIEGQSSNTFLRNFLYFKTGLRIFFSNKKHLSK